MKTLQLVALNIIILLGIMPIAASSQPYVISTDGSEVTDKKTGLIWRRCPEDMVFIESIFFEGTVFFEGTCIGSARTFTHEAALQLAVDQAGSTGIAWRLPNVKELASIADKSLHNPSIDPAAFPATPAGYFWSASPYVGHSYGAWIVDFSDGDVHEHGRFFTHYVRLVRTGQ